MGWTDRFFSSGKPRQEEPQQQPRLRKLQDYMELTPEANEKLQELQNWTEAQQVFLFGLSVVSFSVGVRAGRFQNPWRRFTVVTDIPSSYFGDTAPFLRGRVVKVSDGDTIRFRHTPSIFQQSNSKLGEGEKMSDVALPIRICTIDTPETAKFGKPGQPFGDEAKTHLSSMVENKIVHCKLLQKDQYGRTVAQVRIGWWPFYKYADAKMLQAGLAEVYTGSGAVYGREGKEAYFKMQEKTANSKKGMWSLEDRETAAEYKARTK